MDNTAGALLYRGSSRTEYHKGGVYRPERSVGYRLWRHRGKCRPIRRRDSSGIHESTQTARYKSAHQLERHGGFSGHILPRNHERYHDGGYGRKDAQQYRCRSDSRLERSYRLCRVGKDRYGNRDDERNELVYDTRLSDRRVAAAHHISALRERRR